MAIRTIKVKLHHTQPGNCIMTFVTVGDEKKRYFNRFDSGEWYTVYPSGGYWESDTRVSDDVVFEVFDDAGTILFSGSNGGSKSFNNIEERAKEVAQKHLEANQGIKDYDAWKAWMLVAKEDCGNKDYDDNWLYCNETLTYTEIHERYSHLGLQFEVVVDAQEHKISGRRYTRHYIAQVDKDTRELGFRPCVHLIGFEFDR